MSDPALRSEGQPADHDQGPRVTAVIPALDEERRDRRRGRGAPRDSGGRRRRGRRRLQRRSHRGARRAGGSPRRRRAAPRLRPGVPDRRRPPPGLPTCCCSWTVMASDAGEQAERLIEPIAAGEADLVLGSRARGRLEPGALGMHQTARKPRGRDDPQSPLRAPPDRHRPVPGDPPATCSTPPACSEMTYGLADRDDPKRGPRGRPGQRGAGRLPAARRRRVEGVGQSARLAAGRAGTCCGWRPDERAPGARHRQGAPAGLGQDPAVPAVRPGRRPRGSAGALLDDSTAGGADGRPRVPACWRRPATPRSSAALYPPTTGRRPAAATTSPLRCSERRSAGMTLVSGDAPELPGRADPRALESTADVVIGPSRDGGYCLMRTRDSGPAPFPGSAWSTGDGARPDDRGGRAGRARRSSCSTLARTWTRSPTCAPST